MNNLTKRIIFGALGFAIVIFVLIMGKITLATVMSVVSIIALFEMLGAIGCIKKSKFIFVISVLFSAFINGMCIYNIIAERFEFSLFSPAVVFLIGIYIICSFVYAVIRFGEIKFSDICEYIVATLYVTMFFVYILLIREGKSGNALIWLVLISAWATDTFAYIFGMTLGKHKLIEKVSPKKTVEGSVGGVAGCLVICVIYGIICEKCGFNINFVALCIFSLISAVISQFGDLTASIIKREHNIKDYGNIIPGHGGIMDRFDSVLIVAPVLYFFNVILPIIYG